MSPVSLNYFRRIYQEMQNNLTEKFCSLVAPGQEQQMKNILLSNVELAKQEEAIVTHLKEAFDKCLTNKARRAVLMLMPKSYSKKKVSELFDCSYYEVTRARAVLKMHGSCGEEPKVERAYSRLSIEKARHFINFLFSTGLLQDVAYGTTKLKFESGDKVTISNTILNGIHEHAVKEYKSHCAEIKYDRLGRSTLLNILNKMKPHTRKKLSGVDTFVVQGIEAFEALRRCLKSCENNEQVKELLKCINRSELYLKARFKTHCNYDDPCRSHCINHGLSNPKDKNLTSKCKNIHDRNCAECVNVVDSISSLKLMLGKLDTSHEKEVAIWEVTMAERKILEWQRHTLRGVQQSKARSKAFTELGPTTALWIRDYAQKMNPTKTLEGMNEYFGKRGMTVSVEAFIMKSGITYHKQIYLPTLDRYDQDTLETMCIADVVLEQFSRDHPHIKEIKLKSDNAGNYHANGVAECMYKLGKKRDIFISAYNYNEAQHGKDQCDREAAYFKNCAERWLRENETHKISNAKELLNAVFSNGGPKNTKMCVLRIDKSVAKFQGFLKIPNISYYHTVEFKEDGAVYKEYFDIGSGKFYPYNDMHFVNGASLVVDWTSSSKQDEIMMHDSRNKDRTFPCPETLCILEFENASDLMSHLASNNHEYAKIKKGMDEVILYYAQQKDVHNISDEATTSIYVEQSDKLSRSLSKIYCQGWARKVRKVGRLTPKQKEYVAKLFHQGELTNTKLSAEQMSDRMKNEIVAGQYYFHPEEYLETSQIRSLISRLKKQEPLSENKIAHMSEEDGIIANLDDICDVELCSDDEDFLGFDGSD